MSLLGKKIQLKGLSQKGKNRVRTHGDRWNVLAETNHVLFAPGEKGPWLFISPDLDQNHRASRWVRADGDKDFEVIRQEP